MNTLKRLIALAAVSALAGCATLEPMPSSSQQATTPAQAVQSLQEQDQWTTPALVAEGSPSVLLFTPQGLPQSVRSTPIDLRLDPGATVRDVVAILGELGVPAVISSEEAAAKQFFLPRFRGELGAFLAAVSRATDVWFTWHEGSVVVSDKEKIGLTLAQDQAFAAAVESGLTAMGIERRSVQWQAGMAVVEMTPRQFRRVTAFLERMTANAAVVSMQVAVINVTFNQNARQGIDWERLQASALHGGTFSQFFAARDAWGRASAPPSPVPAPPPPAGGGTSAPAAPPAGFNAPSLLSSLAWGSGGVQGLIFGDRFNLQGLFNFLQTYGDTETKQNVTLKTMAGNKVELRSLTQIPFVAEIGATTTVGGNAAVTAGTTRTEKADDGITLELTPHFDAAANTVTINLSLSLKAVVAFNELSAGPQLGTIRQPTTADRSFTDIVLLRPGQTAVVGGLTFDSANNNTNRPLFLDAQTSLQHRALTVNRQAMFIVLRPTVVRLGAMRAETTPAMDFLPAAPNPPAPAAVSRSETRAAPASRGKQVTPAAAEPPAAGTR
jgi:type II secretory pathway component GspD/PulD (secretin)